MTKKSGKSLKDKLSGEDIDFLEQEALRGKIYCLFGLRQRIKNVCDLLRDYDSVKKYLKSLKEYRDKS